MSRLEDLVPSLEICLRIPEGKFSETAFVWELQEKTMFKDAWALISRECAVFVTVPAPTLQEILPEIVAKITCNDDNGNECFMSAVVESSTPISKHIFKLTRTVPLSPDEALELWLKQKGIEA